MIVMMRSRSIRIYQDLCAIIDYWVLLAVLAICCLASASAFIAFANASSCMATAAVIEARYKDLRASQIQSYQWDQWPREVNSAAHQKNNHLKASYIIEGPINTGSVQLQHSTSCSTTSVNLTSSEWKNWWWTSARFWLRLSKHFFCTVCLSAMDLESNHSFYCIYCIYTCMDIQTSSSIHNFLLELLFASIYNIMICCFITIIIISMNYHICTYVYIYILWIYIPLYRLQTRSAWGLWWYIYMCVCAISTTIVHCKVFLIIGSTAPFNNPNKGNDDKPVVLSRFSYFFPPFFQTSLDLRGFLLGHTRSISSQPRPRPPWHRRCRLHFKARGGVSVARHGEGGEGVAPLRIRIKGLQMAAKRAKRVG